MAIDEEYEPCMFPHNGSDCNGVISSFSKGWCKQETQEIAGVADIELQMGNHVEQLGFYDASHAVEGGLLAVDDLKTGTLIKEECHVQNNLNNTTEEGTEAVSLVYDDLWKQKSLDVASGELQVGISVASCVGEEKFGCKDMSQTLTPSLDADSMETAIVIKQEPCEFYNNADEETTQVVSLVDRDLFKHEYPAIEDGTNRDGQKYISVKEDTDDLKAVIVKEEPCLLQNGTSNKICEEMQPVRKKPKTILSLEENCDMNNLKNYVTRTLNTFIQPILSQFEASSTKPAICQLCGVACANSEILRLHLCGPTADNLFNGENSSNSLKNKSQLVNQKNKDFKLIRKCYVRLHDCSALINEMQRKSQARQHQLYTCSKCEGQFMDVGEFNSHIKSCGTSCTVKQQCATSFPTSCNLEKLQLSQESMKVWTCSKCGSVVTRKIALEDDIICASCKVSVSKNDGAKEIQDFESSLGEVQTYSCDQCNAVFKRKSNLLQHLRVHAEPYRCEECGAMFTTESNLQDHCREHKEEPYECNTCGASFEDLNHLQRHSRTHTDDKDYVLEESSLEERCYPENTSLCVNRKQSGSEESPASKRPEFVHPGLRPYKCLKCGGSFTRLEYLNIHLLVHVNSQRYKQHVGTTASSRNAKLHFNSGDLDYGKLNKQNTAHMTNLPAEFESRVNQGLRTVHSNLSSGGTVTVSGYDNREQHSHICTAVPPNFKCSGCNMVFLNESSLLVHNRMHNSEERNFHEKLHSDVGLDAVLNGNSFGCEVAVSNKDSVIGDCGPTAELLKVNKCSEHEQQATLLRNKSENEGSAANPKPVPSLVIRDSYKNQVCKDHSSFQRYLHDNVNLPHEESRQMHFAESSAKKYCHSNKVLSEQDVCCANSASVCNLHSDQTVHANRTNPFPVEMFKENTTSTDNHNSQYTYPLCSNSFIGQAAFQAHCLTHVHNMEFRCEMCEEYYPTKLKLEEHVPDHFTAVLCNICDESFAKSYFPKHSCRQCL